MNYKNLWFFSVLLGVLSILAITGLPSSAQAAPSGSLFYYTTEGNNYRFMIYVSGLSEYQKISNAKFIFDNSSKATTLGYNISTYKDNSSSHGMSLYIQKRTDGVFYGGILTVYLNDGSSVTVPIKELKTNTDAGGTNTGASYDNGTITISVPNNSQLVDPSAPIITTLSPFPAYKGSLISMNARNLTKVLPTHVDISTDGVTFSSLTYSNAHDIGPFQFTIPQSVAAGKYFIRLRYGNNVSGFGTVHGNYVPIEIKNKAPTVTSVNPNPVGLGLSVTVNGRDFTPTNNDLQLSKDGGKTFSSAGKFPSNGSTISFTEDAEKFPAGNYLLRIVNGNGISNSIPLDITSCAKLSGSGPQKIVFLRGNNVSDPKEFMTLTAQIKDDLLRYDPFMTLKDTFSFYADLKKYDDSKFLKFPTGNPDFPVIFGLDASTNVISSSCANDSPETDIFLFNDSIILPAWTFQFGKTIFLNLYYVSGSAGIVLAHELGHSIGGLQDEYIKSARGDLNKPYYNCSPKPLRDYRGTDGILYGSKSVAGCMYEMSTNGFIPEVYYRPSQDGIMGQSEMNTNWADMSADNYMFNVIDCGYIITGLKSEPFTRENISKHWNECLTMETLKEGIPPKAFVPKVNSITVAKRVSQKNRPYLLAFLNKMTFTDVLQQLAAVGQTVSISADTRDIINISGSGFSQTDNILQLTKISDQNKKYSSYDISSADTENISYSIPPEIETGLYTLKVGAENSGWTDIIATINIKNTPIPYPYDLVAVSDQSGQISLSWKNSTLPNQTAIIIERIDRSKNPKLKILPRRIFLPVGETSYIDTDIIVTETWYSYRVSNYISDPNDPITRIIMRTAYVNATSLPLGQIKPASIAQPITAPPSTVTSSSTSSPFSTTSPNPSPSPTPAPSASPVPAPSPTPSSSPAPESMNDHNSFIAAIWSAILKLFQR